MTFFGTENGRFHFKFIPTNSLQAITNYNFPPVPIKNVKQPTLKACLDKPYVTQNTLHISASHSRNWAKVNRNPNKRLLLQASLQSASQFLFSALDGKAFLRSATVLLPPSWPDTCAPSDVASGAGETSDITILPRDPTRGQLWTQQSLGCGQPGDQIYLDFESLMKADNKLGREFWLDLFVIWEKGL